MDFVCTHQLDSVGPGLDKKWLYWELSQLTHGITQLGPYTLDQDSFYINGEGLPFFFFFFYIITDSTFSLSIVPFPSFLPFLNLSALPVQVTPARPRPPHPVVSILRLQESLQSCKS